METEVTQDTRLELGHLVRASAQKCELIELGADGALETADRVTLQEVLDTREGGQQFLAKHGEALAQGGGLGGHVMRATRDHEIAVILSFFGKGDESRCRLQLHELHAAENLELFHVLREIAAGEAEVDELALGEIGEFLDARFHIVQGHALASGDGDKIHLQFHALIVLDGLAGDGDAQLALCLHHGNPEVALQDDTSGGRPNLLHGGAGVALGKDVGNEAGGLGLFS